MPDVFDVLRADHEQVEDILVRLEETPSAASGATSDELALRRATVERLVMAESRHEAAEEQYLWPVVSEQVHDGGRFTRDAVAQETAGKQMLDRLDGLSPDDAEFETLVGAFVVAAREHISFEQQIVWPRLRAVLSETERETLGSDIERAKKLGPTRPHPQTPPKPGVLKSLGVAAAVLDKARDAMTNRGDPRR